LFLNYLYHSNFRRPDENGNTDWSQKEVNDIAWDTVSSLLKGVQTLHTAWGVAEHAYGYGKYIKSVVHRDIKLKNIGIKKDSDGGVRY
jgi:serine/threonine protein kinase